MAHSHTLVILWSIQLWRKIAGWVGMKRAKTQWDCPQKNLLDFRDFILTPTLRISFKKTTKTLNIQYLAVLSHNKCLQMLQLLLLEVHSKILSSLTDRSWCWLAPSISFQRCSLPRQLKCLLSFGKTRREFGYCREFSQNTVYQASQWFRRMHH